MDISPETIIENHWTFLADHQWQWEFIRRSDQFKKDTRNYLDYQSGLFNSLFLTIWDLPHPGYNCLSEYAYLWDYKTLLTNIMNEWMSHPEGLVQAKTDLFLFAKALSGDRVFYKAPHPLVIIGQSGYSGNDGMCEWWERYISVLITLPKALQDKTGEIIQQIDAAGLVVFGYEIKPHPMVGGRRVCASDYATQARYEHAKWIKDCCLFSLRAAIPSSRSSQEAEQAISTAVQKVLNDGLNPVKFCVRKRPEDDRAEKYTRQIEAVDVYLGLLSKREFMDRHETNDDGYKNYLKGAKKKIKRLEDNAASRRRLFYADQTL